MRLLHTSGRQSKYAILASELATLPVEFPGFQREVAEEHVQQMIEHQSHLFRTFGYYLFLGCLEFTRHHGVFYCIDGQHRFHAIRSLIQAAPLTDFEVVIEIMETPCLDEAEDLFQLVNMSKPLPSFLLQPSSVTLEPASTITKNPRQGAQQLRDYLRKEYKAYGSKSEKPQRPNINVDAFVDAVYKRYPLGENVIEWFEQENEAHRAYLETQRENEPIAKCLDAIHKKTGKALYLGCYWLDSLVNKLSAPIRQKVWKTWYSMQPVEAKSANGEILCPCCEAVRIDAGHFHAGHRTSFKNGGSHSVENLIPLCATCNLSMGVMNYEEYKLTLS